MSANVEPTGFLDFFDGESWAMRVGDGGVSLWIGSGIVRTMKDPSVELALQGTIISQSESVIKF
jgi:hypothetical protein